MWSYENGRYRQYRIPEPISRVPPPSTTHTHVSTTVVPPGGGGAGGVSNSHVFSGDDLTMGLFVTSTGNAAMNNGSTTTFNHNLDASYAYPELQLATKGLRTLGVLKDSDRHIIAGGFSLVWLVRPIKMKLPMSGIYIHTINGIPAPDQVLQVHDDNSFIMFRKAEDEILQLKARLDALTL